MQFQPPAPLQLQKQNTLPQSIDQLFNMYQQNRMNEAQLAQMQQQQQLGEANFRLGNFGLSPVDVNAKMPAAMQPQAQVPGYLSPASQGAQPSFYLQPQGVPNSPMGPQAQPAQAPIGMQGTPQPQTVPDQDPKVAALRQIMNLHMQGAQLGFQGQQAGIQKTQAEGAKARAEAGLDQFKLGLLGGGPGSPGGGSNVITGTVDQMQRGNLPPSDLMDAAGRDPLIRLALQNEANKRGVNQAGIQSQYEADKSGLSAAQIPVRKINSTLPLIDKLDELAGGTAGNSWQVINKYGLDIAAQRGDRGANKLHTLAALISDEIQSTFGSGSDAKLDLAAKMLSTAKTRDQLRDSAKLVKQAFENRRDSLLNKPLNEGPAPVKWGGGATHTYADGTEAEWNGSAWVRSSQ